MKNKLVTKTINVSELTLSLLRKDGKGCNVRALRTSLKGERVDALDNSW